MATRKITEQEQALANTTGGRYRTDLDKDGVALNYKPPRGGSTYIPEEPNMAGAGRGSVNPPSVKPQRSAQVEEAIQEVQDAKDRKKIAAMGYKKGGSVSSASKRADGCAMKGKTKGKMIRMG